MDKAREARIASDILLDIDEILCLVDLSLSPSWFAYQHASWRESFTGGERKLGKTGNPLSG
jgi:hypothetical protein